MKNRSYLKYFSIIGVTCCCATILSLLLPVAADGQRILTLSQAIFDARNNRKNIQAGNADVQIRTLQTYALYRKYWPQVSVEYTYLYNPILQTSILPIGVFNPNYPSDATKSVQFGTKWSQSAGLTVYQPLVDFTIKHQINEAQLQERIAAATQSQTEYDLAYTVAQAYFDIYLQESKIQSAIADTTRTHVNYKLLSDQFGQNRLLKSELNKGKINLNNALQLYTDAVSQMIEDKVLLLFLIGDNNIEQPDVIIDTSIFSNETLKPSDGLPTSTNIPELYAFELKNELTLKQMKTEKSRYLPTFGLKGYIGANQYANNFDPAAPNSWFGQSYVGIDLKYPLLFGEDRHRKLQQLTLQANQFALQKEDRAAQYHKDAVTAKIKMERLATALKTQEENIALSKESVAIYQARVAEGQESAATLNLSEADLQKLDAEYHVNKKQYWLYVLDYLKATGGLWR